MKKKLILIIILIFIICITFFITEEVNFKKDVSNNSVIKKETKLLTMNLEQTAGAVDYKTVTQSNWPTEGYKYNAELSRCENKSKLIWDDTNKTITISGNLSDKCYVYFDKNNPTLAQYVISQYNGVQGNNDMYYHDNSLANGAGDNSYRYAGANPNNFVCFGSDTNPCPENNLYRIIGIFDGKAKLIKYKRAKSNLLGTDGGYYTSGVDLYKWSNLSTCPSSTAYLESNIIFLASAEPNTGSGCNMWNYSDLNKINLNNNYLNNIGAEWSNLIEDTTWKTSGYTTDDVVVKDLFTAEITNATKTYGPSDGISKIGLMYASDYGYAFLPNRYEVKIKDYYNYRTENWLYSELAWTLTTIRGSIFFTNNGAGSTIDSTTFARVYPTFYLKFNVIYKSGTGTSSDPIIIGN